MDGRTAGRTDGRTDGQTYGRREGGREGGIMKASEQGSAFEKDRGSLSLCLRACECKCA